MLCHVISVRLVLQMHLLAAQQQKLFTRWRCGCGWLRRRSAVICIAGCDQCVIQRQKLASHLLTSRRRTTVLADIMSSASQVTSSSDSVYWIVMTRSVALTGTRQTGRQSYRTTVFDAFRLADRGKSDPLGIAVSTRLNVLITNKIFITCS